MRMAWHDNELYTTEAKPGDRWAGLSLPGKVLSAVLILAILAAIGGIVYFIKTSEDREKFTEFYILGAEGKAENYPVEVVLREEVSVIVGIVNREHEEISYRIEVSTYNVVRKSVGPVVLADEEKWEEEVSFMPAAVGGRQKVNFSLYKERQIEPYLELNLWINVNG